MQSLWHFATKTKQEQMQLSFVSDGQLADGSYKDKMNFGHMQKRES